MVTKWTTSLSVLEIQVVTLGRQSCIWFLKDFADESKIKCFVFLLAERKIVTLNIQTQPTYKTISNVVGYLKGATVPGRFIFVSPCFCKPLAVLLNKNRISQLILDCGLLLTFKLYITAYYFLDFVLYSYPDWALTPVWKIIMEVEIHALKILRLKNTGTDNIHLSTFHMEYFGLLWSSLTLSYLSKTSGRSHICLKEDTLYYRSLANRKQEAFCF